MSLTEDLDLARAEAAHWRRVVEWYAASAQWVRHVDDRGRANFEFRYGDDGGWVARQALRQWGIMGPASAAPVTGDTGAADA